MSSKEFHSSHKLCQMYLTMARHSQDKEWPHKIYLLDLSSGLGKTILGKVIIILRTRLFVSRDEIHSTYKLFRCILSLQDLLMTSNGHMADITNEEVFV